MEKEKKLLLPPLKTEEDIIGTQCWRKEDNPYSYLIQNLKLSYEPVDSTFDGRSSAIPHIFEHMLLFEQAFWDKQDPDHLRAVLEWRAVLAIMALPRLCNLRLTLSKVDFLTPGSPFLKAAAEFRPKDQSPPVFDQTTWDFLYVLRLDGAAIAMFSPTTLVCPAKQFRQRVSGLDWLVFEKANDVDRMRLDFRGSGTQKAGLSAWLQELHNSLNPASRTSEIWEKINQVREELTAFSKELVPDQEAAANAMLYRGLYPAINRSSRQEYGFFNNCCDFNIIDPSMEFLVERYHQDIFQNSLIVVVYNRAVDSMNRESHIPLLDGLFSNVFQSKNGPVTWVRTEGGERLAAHALLPFKQRFVEELIQHQLTPEMFIEEYFAVYRKDLDVIEVTLQINGFPYAFYKRFPQSSWKVLYGTEMSSVRLWPSEDLKENAWHAYYSYTAASQRSDARWELPLAEDTSMLAPPMASGPEFQISRTELFPSFLRCVYGSDSGYLPIQAEGQGKGQSGGIALILFDIGHSTTSVKLLRFSNTDSYPPEPLHFWVPRAVRLAGAADDQEENFVSARKTVDLIAVSSFKNIIKTFQDHRSRTRGKGARPFGNGVVLFDLPDELTNLRSRAISFLNFEYNNMDLEGRRNAHAFIEQLLLYAAYTAAQYQCSYLQVGFLHSYPRNDYRVGELEQIFQNALDRAKEWSGLKKSPNPLVTCMLEGQALVYRLYWEIVKNMGRNGEQQTEIQPDETQPDETQPDETQPDETQPGKVQQDEEQNQRVIYAAMDIGWQEATLAVILDTENQPQAKYTQIEFAGKEFSLLEHEEQLHCYPNLLNILLCGQEKVDTSSPEGVLLEELRQYCLGTEKDKRLLYHGIFDMIAQKIDEAAYVVPPDVYNRIYEFRALLQMLTYNMLLLFLNAGYMLGRFFEEHRTQAGQIRFYLSGNGTKFFNWICNLKNPDRIDDDNVDKMFILELPCTAIDAIRRGFSISSGLNTDSLPVSINLLKDGKEQLLNGFALKEQPQLFALKHTPPDFAVEAVDNSFPEESASAAAARINFYSEMSSLRESVFGSTIQGISGSRSSTTQLDELIKLESRSVCGIIIKEINNM